MQQRDNPCDGELIKACSAMPGLGTRNETCGTVSGGIMFLGLLYGRDNVKEPALSFEENKKFVEKMSIATEYADKYMEQKGSTMCRDIHSAVMGKEYEFREFDKLMEFYHAGARQNARKWWSSPFGWCVS
jgi:hypothetical protein